MKKLSAALGLLGLVVVLVSLAGCGGTTNSGDAKKPDPLVKFLNGSPDLAQADFFMNDLKLVAGLGYASPTPDFASVPFLNPNETEGLYDSYVRATGTDADIDRMTSSVARDKAYLIYATGLQNFGSEFNKRLRLTQIELDRTPPIGNKTRLLVMHGLMESPGNETPDIIFQTPGKNPLFKTDSIIFGNVQTLIIDSGTHTFEVHRADTTDSIYISKQSTFLPGETYIALVSGVIDSAGATAPQIVYIPFTTKP